MSEGTSGSRTAASTRSDHAELSTLRSALDESTRRIVAVADRYRDTEDSAIAGDLDTAERGLVAARRSLDRALRALADLT